jgi:hypothetical protein
VAVWVIVELASQYASAAGPGTSTADVHAASGFLEVTNRLCVDPRTIFTGLQKLATIHWMELFGLRAQPVHQYGIDSSVIQGVNGSWVFLFGAMLLAVSGLATSVRRLSPEHEACAYVTATGLTSAAVFAVSRCGGVAAMRYDTLSILAAVGISGWYLCVERLRARRAIWMLLVAGWVGVSALGHARLWSEYLTHPPYGVKRAIVKELEARGVRYGSSDYWIAYYVTFLTNERVIMRADDFIRILAYDREVLAHSSEAVTVARMPCPRGNEAVPGVYFCPP